MCHDLIKKGLWRALLLYAYAFLGGCIFYIIERKPESSRQSYSRLTRQLQENFTTKYNISMNESDFNVFMQKAFTIVTEGNKLDWDIFIGMGFAITSLTTIGYGHITPETPLGQVITVVYCLVGLPFAMLFLKTLGEIIAKVVSRIICMVEKRLFGRKRPRRLKIKTFLLTFILTILTLCLGGLTQKYLEGWTFVEGIYAWFATLSTIGYGDYVPGLNVMLKILKDSDSGSKTSVWLILSAMALPSLAGLCMVSGVLNSLVEALEEFKIQFRVCENCSRYETKKARKFKGNKENAMQLTSIQGTSQIKNTISSLSLVKVRTRSASI